MSTISRRDLFKFGGVAAVGAASEFEQVAT